MPAEERGELKVEGEKDLVVWNAPSRPFKRRDRQFYITLIAIAGIVGLVLFLIEGFMPVILIISLVFLFYVMNTVEPEAVEYKITNKGIKVAGRKTEWAGLGRFWLTRRFDSDLLVIETASLPGRLELVLDPAKEDEVKGALGKYLVEEEIPPSFLDNTANWFSKKLPQS